MTLQKHYTASELTKFALRELSLLGYTVWRANNIAVPGRKFIGRKGMSDIIGYDKSGVSVWCEVKTANDKLSTEQIVFLTMAADAGCRCFIAIQDKEYGVQLKKWS
jgi:hypothetical protein